MKKLIVIATLFAGVFSNELYAQYNGGVRVAAGDVNGDGASGSDKPMESMSLNFTKIMGRNIVQLPNGKGTVKFDAKGDKFSNVEFTNASGKTFKLVPGTGGTAGAPKQDCKYPIPDACFATADKSIGLCMCRPTNLSVGGSGNNDPNAILIGILLPAIQKIRG